MVNGDDGKPDSRRWWALALLTAIYTIHSIDRTVVNIIAEPLKHDFQLSDHAVGLLNGLAHATGFVITVLPLGMLVDRVNRVRLLGTLVTIWSGLTLFCGIANSFLTLAFCRLGVGAAEGGGSSNSLSLISDYFPKRERATAVGFFFTSTAIGLGLTFLLGGMIVHDHGWRAAFTVAGLPGILLGALAFLTLKNPIRGRYDDERQHWEKAPPLSAALKHIATTPALSLSILGLTLGTVAISGIMAWVASFFIRVHGFAIREVGFVLAISIGFVQGICLPLFGRLNDHLSRDRPDRIHLVSMFGLLASAPIGAMMLLATNANLAIAGVILIAISTAAWLAQSLGAVATLAPPLMRGSTIGFAQLCSNLIGTGCGPLLVGALSDAYGGSSSLRYALATILVIYVAAAICLFLATRRICAQLIAMRSNVLVPTSSSGRPVAAL